MRNIIETQLSAEDKNTIDAKIAELENLLANKLQALTQAQREQYGSINEQNKLLVNKVRDYQQNSPTMASPKIDWAEFEKDYQARIFLETRSKKLNGIAYQMQSTKIMHDYDNYHDALIDYDYAQYKKGAGSAGYTQKVNDLKQFFPRSTSKK